MSRDKTTFKKWASRNVYAHEFGRYQIDMTIHNERFHMGAYPTLEDAQMVEAVLHAYASRPWPTRDHLKIGPYVAKLSVAFNRHRRMRELSRQNREARRVECPHPERPRKALGACRPCYAHHIYIRSKKRRDRALYSTETYAHGGKV